MSLDALCFFPIGTQIRKTSVAVKQGIVPVLIDVTSIVRYSMARAWRLHLVLFLFRKVDIVLVGIKWGFKALHSG